MNSVVLVGNPNVGKSVLFFHLTGNYVTVANYPGTTVEVAKGRTNIEGHVAEIYDTPGLYSLSTVTGEEEVTRGLLMKNPEAIVVHVVDAKNLPRMLPLTLELQSSGFRMVLVLNMTDEASRLGVVINRVELARRLGLNVVNAAFAKGRGISPLKKEIARQLRQKAPNTPRAETDCRVRNAADYLRGSYPLPAMVIARLYLEGDSEIMALVEQTEGATAVTLLREAGKQVDRPLYSFALQRRAAANIILDGVFFAGQGARCPGKLEAASLDPVWGWLVAGIILYAVLYLGVGRLGGGILVDLLDRTLLGGIIIPFIERWVTDNVPWYVLRQLLTGEFGVMTLGLRYAFAVIMPIVATFFLMFSVLEDSGYLPRLAYLADRSMSKLGLNGRSVIPLTLGLGCGTMAVLVTRTLESRRERFIATFLLALAVPCSAQLGLTLAVLAREPLYLSVWVAVTGSAFLLWGRLLNLLLPGGREPFFMELPPLRLPRLDAIFQKTLARLSWYLKEVVPIFGGVCLILWLLNISGAHLALSELLAPVLSKMGLPKELAPVLMLGFFRRDYGAAGLYDLHQSGDLAGAQLLVAAAVLTLFLPCLAQLVIMLKERKAIETAAIVSTTAALAFAVGVLLRVILGLPEL